MGAERKYLGVAAVIDGTASRTLRCGGRPPGDRPSGWTSFAVLLLGLSASVPVHAQPAAGRRDCNVNQLAMNVCAAARFEEVDKELNRLYRAKLPMLRHPATRTRFRDAQRAWLAFRDAACLYEAGPREESGSIWPVEHYGCLVKHTERRIQDMRE
ncbi:lysozyme inhibitor LprI family protein [Ramlibacter humi]|uniref:DUF1311 domain-containing protein n=1 Tax=Ramlibacter humi TaxID=2530451 RepID=A0A4Z0BR93_9BURK|nr:lysozyme inhibitor LprI family protein [Ramlibacter humi]TFZ01846.1 DUF1311 domain-containing protein [Ramlibacter humi]